MYYVQGTDYTYQSPSASVIYCIQTKLMFVFSVSSSQLCFMHLCLFYAIKIYLLIYVIAPAV